MGDNDYAGGPTDWKQWSVPQLAEFFAEDHSRAYGHASAWYRTASVADSYRKALQEIRDALAKAWAPGEGSAAAAYLARLGSMIGSLADVHGAALANGEAVNGVLTTLDSAKRRMDQLHDEWRRNDRPLLQAGQPELVTSDWQTPLNQVAWQHMQATDRAVYSYLPRMIPPRPWIPGVSHGSPDQPNDPVGGSAGSASRGAAGGAGGPPVIPPARFPDPPPAAPAPGGAGPAPGGSP